jgi:CxxC motif-containing protein
MLQFICIEFFIKIGDVVLSNVAGTGVDVVAAKNIVAK